MQSCFGGMPWGHMENPEDREPPRTQERAMRHLHTISRAQTCLIGINSEVKHCCHHHHFFPHFSAVSGWWRD